MNLRDSLKTLYRDGFFSVLEPAYKGSGLWTVELAESVSWNAVAQELAALNPGMFYVGRNGIGWACGRGGIRERVVSIAHYLELEPAHKLIRRKLGVVNPLDTASSGGVCKLLLNFAVDPVPYDWESENIYEETHNGYYQCKPGRYENVSMYDAESFYFNLLRRLENPKLTLLGRGKFEQQRFRATEQENWELVTAWVADTPILRHAFVGALMGTAREKKAYCRGRDGQVKAVTVPRKAGPLRPTGILIVRSGYEICQAESLHSQSLYSIIDCVTLPTGHAPVIWGYLGIPYRVKLSGDAHFVSRGVYQLGQHKTEWYKLRSPTIHTPEAGEPQPVPGYSYAANWLLKGANLYGLHNAVPRRRVSGRAGGSGGSSR